MNLKWTIPKAAMFCAAVIVAAAPADASKSNVDKLMLSASLGLGYDSNAYLSPKAPYNDLAQPGNPLIVPKVQSGFYVPIGLGARYLGSSGTEFRYDFASDYYLTSALSNANIYDHDVKLGMHLGDYSPDSDLYVGVLAGYHKNIYYDRDTGEAKLTRVSGTNVSNRYTHYDFGAEASYKQKGDGMDYELATKLIKLNYNDPIVLSPLDHLLFALGGNVRFPLGSDSTKLKLGYDFTMRDYTSRPARDALGVQSRANPTLTYLYHQGSVQLMQKFSKEFMAFLDYERTYRIDRFVHYNNYTKDRVKLRFRYHVTRDFLLRAKGVYTRTNYPNAFAFDNPAAGKKTYKAVEASLKAEYDTSDVVQSSPVFWAKVDYIKQTSSDLRYVYNRTQAVIGADWEF